MAAIDMTPIDTLEGYQDFALSLSRVMPDGTTVIEFWDIDEAVLDAVKALLNRPPDNRKAFSDAECRRVIDEY